MQKTKVLVLVVCLSQSNLAFSFAPQTGRTPLDRLLSSSVTTKRRKMPAHDKNKNLHLDGQTVSPSSAAYQTTTLFSENNNNQAHNDGIQDILEGISKQGAEKLSSVSLAERTKRALLAEQVEDQIFANIYELERCTVAQDAKEIISQTRILRRQYDELVSGEGSSVLNAMEAALEDDKTDKEKEEDSDEAGSNHE